jgi:uncharacterized membrane protein
MRRKTLDLYAVTLVTLACVALVVLDQGGVVRIVTGAMLALVLPGYAITALAFPPQALGSTERATLTLGLSLTLCALAGLMLNATPWGLQAITWAGSLGGITLLATGGALWRWWGHRTGPVDGHLRLSLRPAQGLLFGVSAAIVVAAVVIARTGAIQQAYPGFTQLWLIKEQPGLVQVGIGNHEARPMAYRLQLEEQGSVVADWPSIELDAGRAWTGHLDPLQTASSGGKIVAKLYRLDAPDTVYRQTVLWPGTPAR